MTGNSPAANAPNVGLGARVGTVFLVCLAVYFALYSGDRHLRTRKGPWVLSLEQTTHGVPMLRILQPQLGVEDFRLVFPGEKIPPDITLPTLVTCDKPNTALPLGEWIFDDLMYLPGTVVINLFGHGIQLLPRAASIDGREYPWARAQSIELASTNRVPYPKHKPRR